MDKHQSAPARIFLVVLAVSGWFALLTQLYINLASKLAPVTELLIRYFSYFTILSNLIVAVCCTALLFKPAGKSGFFQQQKTLAAVTVYIIVVGLIYNVTLRYIWDPEGLQRVVDELLHLVNPVLFLIFWLVFAAKDQLKYADVLPWLIYPLGYTIFILIRGAASGFYPYPFIDMGELGLQKTLINAFVVAIIFLVLLLLIVLTGKLLSRKKV